MISLADPEDNATTWNYGVFGQVAEETITVDSTDLTRYFQYDSRGNLARKIDRNGRVTEYEYDGLGRQTSEEWFADVEDVTADKTYTTAYDSLGRVTVAGDGDTDYYFFFSAGMGDLIHEALNM